MSDIKTLQLQLDRVDKLVKYLLGNSSSSLLLCQVISQNENGTVDVDVYKNGTFDTEGNQLDSTSSIRGVIPEDFSTVPSIGMWVTVVKVVKNYYIINSIQPNAETGIKADFFCDLFDRRDSGVLNGGWSGDLSSYIISGGSLVDVADINALFNRVINVKPIYTAAQIDSLNYKINLDVSAGNMPLLIDGKYQLNKESAYVLSFGESNVFKLMAILINTLSIDENPRFASSEFHSFFDMTNTSGITQDLYSALSGMYLFRHPDIGWTYTPLISSSTGFTTILEYAILNMLVKQTTNNINSLIQYDASFLSRFYNLLSVSENLSNENSNRPGVFFADLRKFVLALKEFERSIKPALFISMAIYEGGSIVKSLLSVEKQSKEAVALKINVDGGVIRVFVDDYEFIEYSSVAVNRKCKSVGINYVAHENDAFIKNISVVSGMIPSDIDVTNQTGYGRYISKQSLLDKAQSDLDAALASANGNERSIKNAQDAYDIAVRKANVAPEFRFKDKYHTPIYDDNNDLVGYDYNPNA